MGLAIALGPASKPSYHLSRESLDTHYPPHPVLLLILAAWFHYLLPDSICIDTLSSKLVPPGPCFGFPLILILSLLTSSAFI